MNQGTCKQKKGLFSLNQQLAERACKAENGFCCKDGKITGSTRGRCEQTKGNFSVRKAALSKNCTAVKKNIRTNQTAGPVRPTDKKKGFESTILAKPTKGQKGFDDPLFTPQQELKDPALNN